jgi:hypothetical protein
MLNMNTFGVGVATAASVFGAVATAPHAIPTAAAMAAAGKHRVAAATDESVHRGHT